MDQQHGVINSFGESTTTVPPTPSHGPKPIYIETDHQITDHTAPNKEITSPQPPGNIFPDRIKEEEVKSPFAASPNATNTLVDASSVLSSPVDDKPVPVVKVLSVRGVEYAMMSILLWFGAASLITILASLIMGGSGFESMAFPISVLLVCLPGFAWLFIRLRRIELADPKLRLEPSKRRFSQITQILAFLTCFFSIVGLVYTLVSAAGGEEVDSLGKVVGVVAVILAVAGGILVYYWFDEHKLVGGK
ncbi:hypothetical protein H0V99_00865 [Candidatus Saccharibacteria bacterium]|nr:hypothetical protein [Candidatus Saccharibacteria bacterium]